MFFRPWEWRTHSDAAPSESAWGMRIRLRKSINSLKYGVDSINQPNSQFMPKMTFIGRDGNEHTVEAPIGDTIVEIAHANDEDIEGACEGCMACSTCHVIVEPDWAAKLPPPSEDEEDMLDLAFGLTRTSRLGCQVTITEALTDSALRCPLRPAIS